MAGIALLALGLGSSRSLAIAGAVLIALAVIDFVVANHRRW
jgi:hypothetical protein